MAALALVLAIAGLVGWRLDLETGADIGPAEGSANPAASPAADAPGNPNGGPQTAPLDLAPLDLAPVTAAPSIGSALISPGPIDADAVRTAITPWLVDPVLGAHVIGAVADLSTPDAPVIQLSDGSSSRTDGDTAIPASTTKLLTTTAALSSLGPEATFTTRVVSTGGRRIVLVGGGDPFLASRPPGGSSYPPRADLTTLAAQCAQALTREGRTRVRLGYDDSLFSGPDFNPAWPAHYLPENVVSPITALWVDEGRPLPGSAGRVADPSLYAAQTFAAALADAGISVIGGPIRSTDTSAEAPELAAVSSAPLREIVQHVLETSDNEAAEVLSHQVGVKVSGTGSFSAGVAGVVETLAGLGVRTDDITINDGSGLSRQNLVSPAALVDVLREVFSAEHPELGGVAAGLPVAGFTGSLTNRFDEVNQLARGLVRAKTGTLRNVSSLAGIAVDQQGHVMLFALMADRIDDSDRTRAQLALDAAAGALGACSCGASAG